MSTITHIAFYPSDWLAGTRGLTAAETGIYITLVCMMYERQEPLPHDAKRLSRLCGMPVSRFTAALDVLIDEGKITLVDGCLWNDRVGVELGRVIDKSSKARDSAKARWDVHVSQNETLKRPVHVSKHEPSTSKKSNKINESDMRSQCGRNANQSQSIDDDDEGCARASAREAACGPPDPADREPPAKPEPPTFRERILGAIGVDPVSGLTGPSARMLGTQADMTFAGKWVSDLGLTEDEIIAIVAEVMAKKRDGPPSTFLYFNKEMERLAGVKASPDLKPAETVKVINGARHERPSKSQQRLDAFIAGATLQA